MAMFFDSNWFDDRLAEVGLSHADLARALGLSAEAMRAVWRDQRALTDPEFRVIAMMLHVPEVEVRRRAGMQAAPTRGGYGRGAGLDSPGYEDPMSAARLRAIENQLARLEDGLDRLMRHLGVPD